MTLLELAKSNQKNVIIKLHSFGIHKLTRNTFDQPTFCCPRCKEESARHSKVERYIHDICEESSKYHVFVKVIQAKYYCRNCKKFFVHPLDFLAKKGSKYTLRVRWKALNLYDSGLSLYAVSEIMLKQYGVILPLTTLHDWVVEQNSKLLTSPI